MDRTGWHYHDKRTGSSYWCVLNSSCPTHDIEKALLILSAENKRLLLKPPNLHWVVGNQVWSSRGGYFQWHSANEA